MSRHGLAIVTGLLALLAAGSALAQESLDAGKTGSQLFASDCAICHKSPRGLAKSGGLFGIENFLSEHYTASRETARRIADYLRSVDQGAPTERKRAAKPRGEERAKPRDRKAGERPDSRSPAAQPEVGRPDTGGTDTRPAASDDKAAEKNTPEPGSTASAPRPQARPTERKPDAAEPTEPRAATPKPEASPPGDAQPAKGDGPN